MSSEKRIPSYVAQRDVIDDFIPESDLRRGEMVRIGRALADLGVVVSEAPDAKVQVPGRRPLLARAGPVVDVLDRWDRLVGRDERGRYHLYSEQREELVVREAASREPEIRYEFSAETLPKWVQYVDRERGWDGLDSNLWRALEVDDV